MATYCCDLEKLTTYLVGLGLPVTSCTTGHTGVIIDTDRDLTPEEQALLSRVMVGPAGAYVVPEPTVVTDLVGE